MYHATKTQKDAYHVAGDLQLGVTPKDVALYIISKLSTSGATGYFGGAAKT
jgi:3-isopropylmalate/(R)-2-methylmalate dehydratase large subunit